MYSYKSHHIMLYLDSNNSDSNHRDLNPNRVLSDSIRFE